MKYLFAICASVLVYGADYDCVFIGSSPISLFEALYQHDSGKKVLIVDESEKCGGVWKTIEMCGVEHVDIGCHEIGNNPVLKEFLEVYGGCHMISTEANNFYFSQGCRELIHNLEKRLEKTSIDLYLNTRAECAQLDETNQCVFLKMGEKSISTHKVYLCAYSFLNIGSDCQMVNKSKYYHLYLLIADPTAPRFSYQNGGGPNVSRMMNLTQFVGLENTGRQLIVFQTHTSSFESAESLLSELKKNDLVEESAYILKAEPYVYEQWPSGSGRGQNQTYFETLQTRDFRSMTHYFSKWKEVLKPYREVICERN